MSTFSALSAVCINNVYIYHSKSHVHLPVQVGRHVELVEKQRAGSSFITQKTFKPIVLPPAAFKLNETRDGLKEENRLRLQEGQLQ